MFSTIRVRGHHLLCLQHFKGLGYSAEFVANMSDVVRKLRTQPHITVHLTLAADDICQACPNLRHGSCYDEGADAERQRAAQDRVVLDTLGLRNGDRLPWAGIMDRVRQGSNNPPPDACGECRWLRAGQCDRAHSTTMRSPL